MAEQCYRRDEGNESDRRVYLRNREFERERVADDSNDREGRQRVPKSRWERRRSLPRQTKEQIEASSRYNRKKPSSRCDAYPALPRRYASRIASPTARNPSDLFRITFTPLCRSCPPASAGIPPVTTITSASSRRPGSSSRWITCDAFRSGKL